ncbi:MAG: MotA/TolQ/ExbB proton channel family protein [Candidatus Micrarchaeota archaeon]
MAKKKGSGARKKTLRGDVEPKKKKLVIKEFGIISVVKILAPFYGLLGMLLGIIVAIIVIPMSSADAETAIKVVVGVTLIYFALGLVFWALAAAIYNWLAKIFGGIEMEVK